ncbi:hypothetical protein IC762_12250 [Bradyrhizobium genosp. L]|uniref:hypothetical protein n=1 Tax=Bradyrhizobium genosp. L TaxID=83637 RepID=UPI0018A26EF4|nr:hypothetical protein [Bradyrhizobium genosp. L]QPF87016.1 hypothetical protein IC762_12250 [Bradyrhizobium genosp. L]
MTKLFIALPAFGQQCNSQTTASLVALVEQLARRDISIGFSAISFPDIADLRNVLTTVFHDCLDATHMLMVDADMQFEPALVLDMLDADKPLVGCIYPKKRVPISWVGSALNPPAEPEGNLLELEGIGCGVTLIRRDCIENMIASGNVEIEDDPIGVAADMVKAHGATRMIRAFDLVRDGNRRLSEDFSFCCRHRKSGGKVWAVINHTLVHLGLYQYAGRYDQLYNRPSSEHAA